MNGWLKAENSGKVVGLMNNQRLEQLFDTACLIDIYLGRERIRPHFERILTGDLLPHISVITEAELWRGIRTGELEKHQALLAQFTILPLHSAAAQLGGSWMQQYQATGLGWMDALIVATAKANDLPILTRDRKLANVLANEAEFHLYPLSDG
jgi:predicted nucleic acid-binding protein